MLKRQSDKAVPFAAHGGGLSLLLPELLSVRKLTRAPANTPPFFTKQDWKRGLKGHSKHMRQLKTSAMRSTLSDKIKKALLMKLKPVNLHTTIARPANL